MLLMSILLGSKYCLKHWIPNKWESRMKFWTWPIPKSFGFWGNQSLHGRSLCLFLYFYHSNFQMSANYQKVEKWQIIWNMNEPPVGKWVCNCQWLPVPHCRTNSSPAGLLPIQLPAYVPGKPRMMVQIFGTLHPCRFRCNSRLLSCS